MPAWKSWVVNQEKGGSCWEAPNSTCSKQQCLFAELLVVCQTQRQRWKECGWGCQTSPGPTSWFYRWESKESERRVKELPDFATRYGRARVKTPPKALFPYSNVQMGERERRTGWVRVLWDFWLFPLWRVGTLQQGCPWGKGMTGKTKAMKKNKQHSN